MAQLKLKYGAISTDEHIQEAPGVWTDRMPPAKWGDDVPHIVEMPDGSQEWRMLGEQLYPHGKRGALAFVIGATRNGVVNSRRWEDVPRTTYMPSERLKAMDRDEVDTNTFFPNICGVTNTSFQKRGSPDFRLACLQAYNDWLVEEWADYSPRYIAQCLPPLWDPHLAAAEIARSVKRGHRGVVFHGAPEVLGFANFSDPAWDPVFQVASDLDVPLCLHSGAVPRGVGAWPQHSRERANAVTSTSSQASAAQVLSNVLWSGVLQRFPKVKFVLVESGVGWVPYVLEVAEHYYDALNLKSEGLDVRPTALWKQHFYVNFWFEKAGIQNRHAVGVENILYETDFPHVTSTWPHSKAVREESLAGVPPGERAQIMVWNAARLYHLDVDASAVPGLAPAQ